MMAIAEKQTTREAWEAIREMRIGEDRAKKARVQILKRSFDRLIMEDPEGIVEFSQKLTTMVGEICSLGTEMKESIVVEKLFNAVPDKFLQIVSTIEQWRGMSIMSLSEAIGRLSVFEDNMKGRRTERAEKEKEKPMPTRAQWESLAIKEKKTDESSNRGTTKHGRRDGGRGTAVDKVVDEAMIPTKSHTRKPTKRRSSVSIVMNMVITPRNVDCRRGNV